MNTSILMTQTKVHSMIVKLNSIQLS